jgi:uncharacterized protein YndB with AHSA1/START domain
MIKREDDGLWIVLEEKITVDPEVVWGCLTTASGLARWFPVAARIDLRTGGTIVLGWDERFRHTSTVAILDYDAGGTVVWDWQASVHERHAPVYWSVDRSVEEGAIVRFRQGPFANDEDSLIAMAEEATSWQWRLCNLRSTLEAKLDMRKVRPL